jgi:PTS system nitrogen regulatory IIA component
VRIVDFLQPTAVIADLQVNTADEALRQLCRPLTAAGDPARLAAALIAREKVGSTGVGAGFAIPHARIAGLPRLVASFGRSVAGIEFGAIDNQPVRLFLALFAPEGNAGLHLKALARISRLFRSQALHDALLAVPTAGEMYRLIAQADFAADGP